MKLLLIAVISVLLGTSLTMLATVVVGLIEERKYWKENEKRAGLWKIHDSADWDKIKKGDGDE